MVNIMLTILSRLVSRDYIEVIAISAATVASHLYLGT
jgi:hypothetical protein